jgi:hypothetical protein
MSIHNFVKEALSKNVPRKDIQKALTDAGWRDDEIRNALDAYADVPFPVPVPRRRPYISAQEAFMYLLLFLTLYISAVSTGTLLFQFTNRLLPDPLDLMEGWRSFNFIRQAAASLIIAYPVFMFVTLRLRKAIAADPDKRASKIRKWLTYITLFIAAGIIIGDLITLVFNLLQGDLTLRFVLKVASVGLIAGTIFGYYLWDLKRDDVAKGKTPGKTAKLFAIIVSSVVTVILVAGLIVGGLPSSERARRFDDERVMDLQNIRFGVIDEYYRVNGRLPESLDEARRATPMSGESFLDPGTDELYAYERLGERTYSLCATFDLPSTPESAKVDPAWTHEAGTMCYTFDVTSVTEKVPIRSVPVRE